MKNSGAAEPAFASERIVRALASRALDLARAAGAAEEVPVGAVIADFEGRVVAEGENRTRRDCDPSAHAEIVALRAAARAVGNYRLPDLRLVSTLEPCPMCAGAIFEARLAAAVYAAPDPKAGAFGGAAGAPDLSATAAFNHHARIARAPLAEESADLLRAFFARRRGVAA